MNYEPLDSFLELFESINQWETDSLPLCAAENICSEFDIRLNVRSNSGLCFCPFHDNHNTPAAKIYKDDAGDSLYCFSVIPDPSAAFSPFAITKSTLLSFFICGKSFTNLECPIFPMMSPIHKILILY